MTLYHSAVHHGFEAFHNQTSGDSECIDPSYLELHYPREMTRNHGVGHGFADQQPTTIDFASWTFDLAVQDQSVPRTPYCAVPGSDATKSPGRRSNQQSSGISEDTGSPSSHIVFTPNSSHDYNAYVNDGSERAFESEDDAPRSPLSDSYLSNTTDSSFFFVNHPETGDAASAERSISKMNLRPQFASSGGSARRSRESSVAKSSTSHHSTSAPWNARTRASGVMGHNHTGDLPGFIGHDGVAFDTRAYGGSGERATQYELLSDLNLSHDGMPDHGRTVTPSSFRAFDESLQHAFDDFAYATGSSYDQAAPSGHRPQYFGEQYASNQAALAQQHVLPQASPDATSYATAALSVPPSFSAQQALASSSEGSAIQDGDVPFRSHPSHIVVHQPQPPTSRRAAPYPHAYQHAPVSTYQHTNQRRSLNVPSMVTSSTAPSRRVQLAPREVRRPPVLPSNAPVDGGSSRKGGRARHTHLPDDVRQQVSKMRGVTACWRCALQRDKCDDAETCRRCAIRSQKGQRDLFGCDRSKLPEWIDELLPDSMTDMHSRKSIETYVGEQVTRWNTHNSIDIYLTSGYGPPLMWRCCEFQPKDQDLLGQLQYLQETSTGTERRRMKYSPPFALEKLDEGDDAHFQEYLDNQLMHPEVLSTLGWTFYEEECIVDPHWFQARVLELMCTLHSETGDMQLREALRDVLRMLIVTYIMGHTLTIAEDTLPTVLASVRYTPRHSHPEQHTSPRLANRQLKHYFSSLRHNTYLKVLHRQQQTFHDSKKKEAHWLVSFCAMLGLAMVLEEIQITIQIQADAKWVKREMTQEAANAEALGICQRIDAKFERLVFYFQKKYRDRKWSDDGSFGRGTPNYRTLAESNFLASLHRLLVERQEHLRTRESTPLGAQYQCQYTTRLVAKFLLPFLNLAT